MHDGIGARALRHAPQTAAVDRHLRARARTRAGSQLACGADARGHGEHGDMRARATGAGCEARTSVEDLLHVPRARLERMSEPLAVKDCT